MEAEFKNLEKRLAGMKPRAPSDLLREELTREMNALPPQPSGRPVLRWAGALAVAATLVLALGLGLARRSAPPAPTIAQPMEERPSPNAEPVDQYELVDTRHNLLDARDEGVVLIDGYGPVRAYRYRALNHAEWTNPRNGRRLAVTRPAEELVLVRMNMN